MSKQVFISYSRHDGHAHAERLENKLKAAGYRVWRDTRNINPNQDFTAEIEVGIEKSDLVAVCVTPDTKRPNSFVRREIQYTLAVGKPIFPCIMLKDVIPHASIINFEWLEFHKDWDVAFKRLCQLVGDPGLQAEPGEYQAPPDDPFRDYLQKLYQQIVRYLDQAVIKLIDLEAETSPDAVPQKQSDDLILEFFESSIFTDDTPTEELPTHTTFKEAFDYHKGRLLLLGEPGAGKTITLMSHARDAVAARLEDPVLPLPILKIIPAWKSNPPMPIIDFAAGKMANLKPVIAAGKALLLLDGLDELGERSEIRTEEKDPKTGEPVVDKETGSPKVNITYYDPRKRFIQAVEDIHDKNQVLVTCRMKDYADIGQQIPLDGAITLQPLTDDQLHEYLTDHSEIYAAIQADAQLRDLARTPLLLSLITFAWDKLDAALKDKGDLQAGDVRDAIFEAYCRQRYEHEAKKRNADLPFTYQEMMDILGELAMWNAQGYRPRKRFGDDRKPKDNLLIPYDFEYIIKANEQVQAFQQMTTHLNILAPINESDYRFVHLLLRDFLAYTFALPRLRDTRFFVRSYAAEALGQIGDARAVESLIVCLGDKESSVRSYAAEALGQIGDTRAIESLIACLHSEDSDMRRSSAKTLGKIGWQPQNEGQEIQYLIASQNWNYLVKKGKVAVEPLIACLSDASGYVTNSVAKALDKIGGPAVEPLIACLNDDDEDSWVRSSAAQTLGKIGDVRAVETLIACLSDDDWWVRLSAAEALCQIGWQPQNEGQEIQCLIASQNWNYLVKKGKVAVEPLIACLSDDDGDVRQSAAEALGEIGDARAVEPLVALLDDEAIYDSFTEVRVCDYAYDALQKIGTPEALKPCEDCVAAGNEPRL